MSQKCEFQYNLLPFETIKEATKGDVDAVEEVLKHYDGYIDNLSRRKMYDEYGQIHYCVDETLKVSALSKGGFSMHTNPVIMIARC